MLKQLWKAINENNLTEIKRLLSQIEPEDLLLPVENHMSVLHLAAHTGNVEAFRAIVDKNPDTIIGKDPNKLGGICLNGEYHDWNVLTFAAVNDKDQESVEIFEIVKSKLPQAFAQITIISYNQTLLHLAAVRGKPLLCEWLACYNPHSAISPDLYQGLTPIHRAIDMHQATGKNHTEALKILISKVPESAFNQVYGDHGTFLDYAVKHENETACLYLIPKTSPELFVQNNLINLARKAGMNFAVSAMSERDNLNEVVKLCTATMERFDSAQAAINSLSNEITKLKLDNEKIPEVESKLANITKMMENMQKQINETKQVDNKFLEDHEQDIQVEQVILSEQLDVSAVGAMHEHCS